MVDDPVNPWNLLKGLVHRGHEAKLPHVELLIYCRGTEVVQTSGVGGYIFKGGLQYHAYNKVREANLILFIM